MVDKPKRNVAKNSLFLFLLSTGVLSLMSVGGCALIFFFPYTLPFALPAYIAAVKVSVAASITAFLSLIALTSFGGAFLTKMAPHTPLKKDDNQNAENNAPKTPEHKKLNLSHSTRHMNEQFEGFLTPRGGSYEEKDIPFTTKLSADFFWLMPYIPSKLRGLFYFHSSDSSDSESEFDSDSDESFLTTSSSDDSEGESEFVEISLNSDSEDYQERGSNVFSH